MDETIMDLGGWTGGLGECVGLVKALSFHTLGLRFKARVLDFTFQVNCPIFKVSVSSHWSNMHSRTKLA